MRSSIVLLVTAIGLTACFGNESANSAGENGGTLVISVGGEPDLLFPPLSETTSAQIVDDLVYDRLAEIGDSLSTVGDVGFKPRLAKSWTWAADSLSIAFHIDSAARWHDGVPVRSADVKSTYRVITDTASGSPFAVTLASIDSVTTPDSMTAVFWFKKRSPLQFFDAVYNMSILPDHLLKGTTGPALRTFPLGRTPVGTGRFRFVSWTPGSSIQLAADTSNYRGRPHLDRVIVTISPDFNTALTRLVGGEADILEQVPAASLPEIAKDTMLNRSLDPGLDYNFVQFNLKDPKQPNRPHRLFGDRALRRALSAAVDRANIVKNVYDSLAYVALGPTVRAYPTTDTTIAPIAYSVDKARHELDSLGWKDSNGDGVRDKGGVPLEFTLDVPGSSKARTRMAVLIQEQLKQVGVKMNIDQLDFPGFIAREGTRKFDAVFGGWHVEASPGSIRQTWGSAGAAKGGTNYGSYSNPVFDAHVDSALSAQTLRERRAHFTAAYRIIDEDAPAIWFAEPKRIMAVNRRIETGKLRADLWWANLADWKIPADKRIARDASAASPKR
ncbi:MAG TPA: peptide ABC transporter substrate-binding protein [Gemmatimonadaceae bacterium]|nr:peptide ABC transporter substrate-binding protein [Gemmatimonadaceae bacterium]